MEINSTTGGDGKGGFRSMVNFLFHGHPFESLSSCIWLEITGIYLGLNG